MGIPEEQLSKEAADQLVKYLYWLIDEIQFSRPYREWAEREKGSDDQPDGEFDDPIPFGKG